MFDGTMNGRHNIGEMVFNIVIKSTSPRSSHLNFLPGGYFRQSVASFSPGTPGSAAAGAGGAAGAAAGAAAGGVAGGGVAGAPLGGGGRTRVVFGCARTGAAKISAQIKIRSFKAVLI
jgi:hypothetical protein